MENTATMSIKLPLKLKDQIELLARVTQRSASFCIVEAIQAYVEKESWQIDAIKNAIKNADRGRIIEHTEVVQWVENWDTEHEKETPESA